MTAMTRRSRAAENIFLGNELITACCTRRGKICASRYVMAAQSYPSFSSCMGKPHVPHFLHGRGVQKVTNACTCPAHASGFVAAVLT
eukprot:6185645-Pleurochrysis_carterae.AAC.2